jgi:hypothetical protein
MRRAIPRRMIRRAPHQRRQKHRRFIGVRKNPLIQKIGQKHLG